MRKIILLIFVFFIISCKNEKSRKDINWVVFNDKNKIPEQIKDFFQAAENGEIEIANPDEEFNTTDVVTKPNLPFRQLRLLEKKNELWRMVYIQGGIGKSYQFYEFKIQGDTISDVKKGYSFENIGTNDSLEYYIGKGKLKFEKVRLKYKWID
ncbi:hypothetical protein HIO71_11720 [Chryseobacterium aquaticum]|uniref:Lipoprotein n=1 Tax=Chryseobacterium aquaticum TaxID=452084 RepID=A0A848N7D3_9FLAO|nr:MULTISPECIES: hypothetical protein [Chryseobacterium]NMR34855.1 hypothetical protein [Chryseobacterium aquaticum]NRQ46757.1 hypothetical protein [Chryseobacterium sp. C-204]